MRNSMKEFSTATKQANGRKKFELRWQKADVWHGRMRQNQNNSTKAHIHSHQQKKQTLCIYTRRE